MALVDPAGHGCERVGIDPAPVIASGSQSLRDGTRLRLLLGVCREQDARRDAVGVVDARLLGEPRGQIGVQRETDAPQLVEGVAAARWWRREDAGGGTTRARGDGVGFDDEGRPAAAGKLIGDRGSNHPAAADHGAVALEGHDEASTVAK